MEIEFKIVEIGKDYIEVRLSKFNLTKWVDFVKRTSKIDEKILKNLKPGKSYKINEEGKIIKI